MSLAQASRFRRLAFNAWAAILVAVFGVVFFGLTSLVIAWFQEVEGVAGPLTDLGYGVLFGNILTTGLLVQLRGPERKIAGVQQAFLVIPALVIGSAIASDSQNLLPALILPPAIGILLALHPAREEFLRRGAAVSRRLLAITVIGARPARRLRAGHGSAGARSGRPPHHVQRLSTMAAMAVAIVLTGLLAALQTRGGGSRRGVPGWLRSRSGLGSVVFPDDPGAVGRRWGGVAIAGGVLLLALAEWEARRVSSGLADVTDYRRWLSRASRSPSTGPIDTLRFAASHRLTFPPGSRWRYSNTNYIALGLVIEKATGRPYRQELEQRILEPLGLDRTELPKTRLLPDLDDDGENPNVPWAAGAIVSNARDLSLFFASLLSGRILSEDSIAEMKQTVPVDRGLFRDGLGIFSTELPCGRFWVTTAASSTM